MSKTFIGKVVSLKMNKTLLVEVETSRVHPIYKKTIKRSSNYKVHNEDASVKAGDVISFVETRPISKDKKYKFDKIIKQK